MAKDRPPSFQFYPRDFMADTGHLTDRQRSHYLLALCRSWLCAGYGVGTPDEWREWFGYYDHAEYDADLPALRALLWVAPCEPVAWVQKRMAIERGEQLLRYREASRGGQRGNATRWGGDRGVIATQSHTITPASASASEKQESKTAAAPREALTETGQPPSLRGVVAGVGAALSARPAPKIVSPVLDRAAIWEIAKPLGNEKGSKVMEVVGKLWKSGLCHQPILNAVAALMVERNGMIANPYAYFNPKGDGFARAKESISSNLSAAEGEALKRAEREWLNNEAKGAS